MLLQRLLRRWCLSTARDQRGRRTCTFTSLFRAMSSIKSHTLTYIIRVRRLELTELISIHSPSIWGTYSSDNIALQKPPPSTGLHQSSSPIKLYFLPSTQHHGSTTAPNIQGDHRPNIHKNTTTRTHSQTLTLHANVKPCSCAAPFPTPTNPCLQPSILSLAHNQQQKYRKLESRNKNTAPGRAARRRPGSMEPPWRENLSCSPFAFSTTT